MTRPIEPNEMDRLLAGFDVDAGLIAARLLAELDGPAEPTPSPAPAPFRARQLARTKAFKGHPSRRDCRRAVNFVFDDRERWSIAVVKGVRFELRWLPTKKLEAYLQGRHGSDEQERLRAWVATGVNDLIARFDEEALMDLFIPIFDLSSLDGGEQEAMAMTYLRSELKKKALHAATQGQAPALKVFFEGDLFAAAQPASRPPRAEPRAKRLKGPQSMAAA